MCIERRPTIGRTNMSGDKPEKTLSLTLSDIQIYRSVVLAVIATVSVLSLFTTLAVSWMTDRADTNFHDRLKIELHPPDGEVWKAIDRETKERDDKIYKKLRLKDKQDVRTDMMLEEVYEKVLNKPAPPRISE